MPGAIGWAPALLPSRGGVIARARFNPATQLRLLTFPTRTGGLRPSGRTRALPVPRDKERLHDARAREVRPRNTSWEADEQGGRDVCCRCCGAGGAKGGGQGERERAKHAPDTGSGERDTGARSRTESCKAKEEREAHRAPTPHQ